MKGYLFFFFFLVDREGYACRDDISTCGDPCSRHTTRLGDTLYRYRKGKGTGPVDRHRLVSLRSNTLCMPKLDIESEMYDKPN